MSLVPIKGQDGFFRDTETNAIINKNNNDYQIYINNRKRISSDKERLSSLEDGMDKLKDDLNEIKELLKRHLK